MAGRFLSSLERGAKSPTLDTLEKLAQALGVSLSELLFFDAGAGFADTRERQLQLLLQEYADKIQSLFQKMTRRLEPPAAGHFSVLAARRRRLSRPFREPVQMPMGLIIAPEPDLQPVGKAVFQGEWPEPGPDRR